MHRQQTFNPIDYGFTWTNNWYTFDRKLAHSQALKARNAKAKELKAKDYNVVKSTMRNQLISKGGIGSGKPHIELYVNIYMLKIV